MTAVWFCPLCNLEGDDVRRLFCPEDGTRVRPIAERGADWLGRTVAGKYTVLRFLGHGGMADVFEVERVVDGKRLALKILNAESTGNERLNERFRREAMLISLIAHPNVVNMLDFGTLEDSANYMVMELLSGRSLKAALSSGPMAPDEACRILLQVCEGMAAAHERGVIHRDLKPDNIFLQDMGAEDAPMVKILDLGIGRLYTRSNKRLTHAGTLLGTPEYMSPEQCNGEEAGIPSDIYAMGVMLYELFMGFLPFQGTSFLMTLSMHAAEVPIWHEAIAEQRSIPPEAQSVVLRALSKSPEDRQESMLEFQRDVAALLSRIRHAERFSLDAPAPPPAGSATPVPKTSIPRTPVPRTPIPRAAMKEVSLSLAEGNDREVVRMAEDIYWVGRRRVSEMENNAYLRVFRGESTTLSMLVDPGRSADFEITAAKISHVIGGLENLNYIFLSGPDLDAAESVGDILRVQSNLFVICSEDTLRVVRRLGIDARCFLPVERLPGRQIALPGDQRVLFIPAPFCRFRGATMAFDLQSAVLFSGLPFSGIGTSLLANPDWSYGLSELHSIYMPSKPALTEVLRTVDRLDPPPSMIAPRLGAVIRADLIQDAVDCLSQLPIGPRTAPDAK